MKINTNHPAIQRLRTIVAKPFVKRTGIGLLVFFLLFGLFGYFVLPGIVKSQAEQILTQKLQRKASIGKVEISPYALSLTLRDFKLLEPQSETVFASFDALTVNISAQSLWRLAPVVQELRLSKPYVHLVRKDARSYNIDDILQMGDKQAPSKEPARFSIYNIQIDNGRIVFEDLPEKTTHTVADLKLGVPFVSSLPSKVEVFVEPMLSATFNGTPLLLKGKVLPYAEPKEAMVELNLDGLDLPRYLEYLPFQPSFKVPSARLDVHMRASFQQPKEGAAALLLSGTSTIKSLQLTELNGKSVLKLPELSLRLDRTNVLGKRIDVAQLALNGLELDATRDSKGQLSLLRLLPTSTAAGVAGARRETKVEKEAAANGTNKATNKTAEHPPSAIPQLELGEFDIHNATLRYGDEQPNKPMSAGVEKFDLGLRKIALDMSKKTVNIDEVVSASGNFQVRHDKPTGVTVATPAVVESKPATTASEAGYTVSVGKIALQNWSAKLEDRSLPRPAVTQLSPISLTMTGLSTAPDARGKLELKAAVNQSGQLAVNGALGLAPLHTDLNLDLKAVDILPLQPYVTDKINLLFTRASLSGKGALQLDQRKDGVLTGGFKGDVTLGDLATVDKLSSNDFLRWKSLYFGGVDVKLEPFSLAVDQIALADFFARVIIDPSGRINLQDIARAHPGERKSLTDRPVDASTSNASATNADPAATSVATSVATSAAASNAAANATPEAGGDPMSVEPTATSTPAAASASAAAAPVKMPPIKIRKLTLQGGKVRFTDNFIKPNYTANLMDLGGVVQGLSSDPASSATVDLRGQVNSAPLSVAGNINPLKGDLALDIQAKVRDMELAPLSPYSGRYIGYGIEKGKLSFDVAYQIADRKLTAQNRLILDQLTFGDKVDSPGAANLPVHLAVALLRDRNGVIDINLPISGSLDDPQFSMGGIIVKVIVNLIAKAATAPFTLLGSLFGGGEELSYLEFAPGSAVVPPAGEAKLKSLAKALTERPAIKLEITGRSGGEAEREGYKRAAINRKVRALKIKEIIARGESVPAEGVTVKPEEYPALLAKVYKAESFPKPRNLIGMQKDLPVEEMEKLMIANTTASDDDLTALGNARAQAVKDWLLKNGQVPGERVFILAAKPAAEGKDDKGKKSPSRVDFSLK
ncbi:MAG: DUF748 domain-containing protein [Proteobacteria bacterium]|nr:DUF748 domain-containing protein [Pseudomonadota bacterium]